MKQYRKVIDGHKYLIEEDASGTIIAMTCQDDQVIVTAADPDLGRAKTLCALDPGSMKPADVNQLIQLIAKRLYGLQ